MVPTTPLKKAFAKVAGYLTLTQKFRRFAGLCLLAVVPFGLTACNKTADEPKETPPDQRVQDTAPPAPAWQDAQGLCSYGCPVGAPATNKVVDHKILVLSNNGQTKFADWVAYAVSKETIGPSQDRVWRKDPALPADETLSARDYKGIDDLDFDRGHQAPLASLAGTPYWRMTNYLSNITPQKQDLNAGAWAQLERAERNLARFQGVTVHVVTGPLYERAMPKLPRARLDHQVPSGYWKVIVVEQGNDAEAAAFIMDQSLTRRDNYCDQKVTVQLVESRSHLDLLPNLPTERQEQVQTGSSALLAKMGCR